MKRILFVVALAMISATTMFAQSKLSNYTELILNSRRNMTAEQFRKSPMSVTVNNESIDCFVHFQGQSTNPSCQNTVLHSTAATTL